MSNKPNGAVIELAQALQKCFDAATSKATEAAERAQNAAERAERAVDGLEARMDAGFEKTNATLRMIWQQCGGKPDQRLPIDD